MTKYTWCNIYSVGFEPGFLCDTPGLWQAAVSTSDCRCGWAWWIGDTIVQIPNLPAIRACCPACNKGRIVGQKRPLLPKHVWAIRVCLKIAGKHRDLAHFNLAIDSKLPGYDLVCLKVADVFAAGHVKEPASIIQSKTQKTVRFEITEATQKPLLRWIGKPLMTGSPSICGQGGSTRASTFRQ